MKQKRSYIVPALVAAASMAMTGLGAVAQAQTQPAQLLPQGSFDQAAAGNKPGGWEIMWGQENVSLAGAAPNRWVQLRDGAVLNQVIKLPAGAKTIAVSARLKLSNYEKGPEAWHRARVSLTFLNDAGKMVGTYPAIPDLTANSDWVTKEVTLQVPADATQLQLQPGLWGSKGVFEIDNLAVRVASTTTAPVPAPSVAADAPWPASAKVAWGSEPVDVQSSKRARINLNGVWKFSPAQSGGGQANTPPEKGWGYLGVPGNWRRYQEMIAKGTGPQWSSYNGITLSAMAKLCRARGMSAALKCLPIGRAATSRLILTASAPMPRSGSMTSPPGRSTGPKAKSTSPIWSKPGKKSHCAPLSWQPSNRATFW
jgi:hypothetical protein